MHFDKGCPGSIGLNEKASKRSLNGKRKKIGDIKPGMTGQRDKDKAKYGKISIVMYILNAETTQ